MQDIAIAQPLALSAEVIASIPPVPLGVGEGVVHRILWQNENSMAGVLTVPAGRSLGLHTHRTNHHHIWVIEGQAAILGSVLGPGSYAHVPHGVEHDIDASATDGCTLLYFYLR